jgi:hypothetical protein
MPFPQQPSSWFQLGTGTYPHLCVCFELLGKVAELPLRRSTQAAESEFLHPIRDGSHEQLAAEVG